MHNINMPDCPRCVEDLYSRHYKKADKKKKKTVGKESSTEARLRPNNTTCWR